MSTLNFINTGDVNLIVSTMRHTSGEKTVMVFNYLDNNVDGIGFTVEQLPALIKGLEQALKDLSA